MTKRWFDRCHLVPAKALGWLAWGKPRSRLQHICLHYPCRFGWDFVGRCWEMGWGQFCFKESKTLFRISESASGYNHLNIPVPYLKCQHLNMCLFPKWGDKKDSSRNLPITSWKLQSKFWRKKITRELPGNVQPLADMNHESSWLVHDCNLKKVAYERIPMGRISSPMYTYSKFNHAHLLFHFWRLFSRWASQKSPPPIVKNPPRKKKKQQKIPPG